MEKLISEFSVGLFFWQSLVFLVLLFLLRKFAWKPILSAIEEREQSIEGALKSAEEAKKEMQSLQASNEALLKEAREERDVLLAEARDTKNQIIQEAKQQAKGEAEKLMSQAREVIDTEKKAAMAEIKNQVSDLSVSIAEKILKAELSNDKKQQELVSKLLEEVKLK